MGDESTVYVEYTKYDGSLHWNHPALPLGEDEHGVWVGMRAGGQARRGYAPPVTYPEPFVLLFPRDAWWTACFNAAPHRKEIYCDVTTVPRWEGPKVTMVDLDLDVIRRREGGEVFLDDADEFEEHQVRYGYPADVIASARRSADWLMAAVADRVEPFGEAYLPWLKRLV